MAKKDDVRSFNQIKAYPRGSAQGGRAIQAVKGNMAEYDGIDGHRTVIRETSEGRAIARTRDRMPMVEVEKLSSELYLESGALTWQWPGDGNQPHSGDPAKWRFLDISPTGDWLGEVDDTGEQSSQQPTPIDTGALRDNIDSLAVGYTRSSDPARDYVLKMAAKEKTVAKKVTAGWFPATLWSGKMRLFMQAQYGAAQDSPQWRLGVEFVGTSAVLRYINTTQKEGEDLFITLGYWAHGSPGIYTAPDGNYYLINITRPAGVEFVVHAYKLRVDEDAADDLLDLIASPTTPPDEVSKIEAYLFAHSVVDFSSKREIGRYTPAGGVTESALAYGWKFKNDGSEAGIVLTGITGEVGALYIRSTTVKMSFTYNPVAGQKASPAWITVEGSSIRHPDWIDGWGSYNIFTPEDELSSAPLTAFSVVMVRPGIRNIPNFSNVHIYGYYFEDVWTPVVISKTTPEGPFPIVEVEYEGITPYDGTTISPNDIHPYEAGYMSPNSSARSKVTYTSESVEMTVALGGFSYNGEFKTVTENYWQRTPGEESYNASVAISFISQRSMPFYGLHPNGVGTQPAGDVDMPNDLHGVRTTRQTWSYTGGISKHWAILIPARDCEAVYIATKSRSYDGSFSPKGTATANVLSRFTGTYGSGAGSYNVVPWCAANEFGGWYGFSGNLVSTIEPADPIPKPIVSVYAFDRKVQAAAGTPAQSYVSVFTVDKTYPFYAPGMVLQCSYNKRHWGTEGIRDPASVPNNPNFVGWV